ncbi:hypothetical protein DERP_001396 [Dermatophagoides pteronyssinus]|uniref:Peptidase S1 domain-containing protein n=1 Tax=Dermatophagoides pteronyssinus TaxID=6956 RepID=A0ABQ8JF34_DERPT|nr:hypothetical protein DERP_001396 [Dermatophagoides pteronyssinus]
MEIKLLCGLSSSSTLARIQQITKCPEHSSPSIESSNNGVYSTITSGNGNLVLYSSNICPSTRSLINNTNRVINNNNSSTVKHIPNPTLLTQKTDIGTITNDQMKPRSASNTNLPDTASPISRKRSKLNTVECTQSLSTNAKCQIKGVKVKDDEEIQVSINPKSIFFTSSNVQKVHNQQITNNNSKTLDTLKLNKSTNDQNNTGNSVQNQQSVNTTRFVGIVNRLNSYHNETLPENIFDTDDEDDDDDLDMNFGPYFHDSTTIASVDNLASNASQLDSVNTNSNGKSSIVSQSSDFIIQLTSLDPKHPVIAAQSANLPISTDHDHASIIRSVNVANVNCNDKSALLLDPFKTAIVGPQQSNFNTNNVTDKKQSKLNTSLASKQQDLTTKTASIMLSSSSIGQTECDSFKTIRENGKFKSKKSSKPAKRPTIHKDESAGLLKKNDHKKPPSTAKAIDQQHQRLEILQRKRRQVWLQLLPQITAKKDRIMATKIERKQRLRLIAYECQKQWHKYSKQKHRITMQEPINMNSVVNKNIQPFSSQSDVLDGNAIENWWRGLIDNATSKTDCIKSKQIIYTQKIMSSTNQTNQTSLKVKLLKAQKWYSRFFAVYNLLKSIEKDYTNYNELKEAIHFIEKSIIDLENHLSQIEDDDNNENYKEEVIIIIQDLKNRRQNLIEQKTLFPKETAEVAAKYSVSALCGTLASGVVMSTPSSLGIWAARNSFSYRLENLDDSVRIIGGEDARPHQFPWMVYMKLYYIPLHEWQKSMTNVCDGTLINNRWIISAAHCFEPNGYNLSQNIVFLGSHNITEMEEKGRKVIKAKKAIIHEQYDHWNIKNDIALVELSEIIEFDEYISPIHMLNSYDNFDHDQCLTLGWGRIGEHMEKSDTLKKVQQSLQTMDDCRKFYSDLDDTQVCAGTLNHGPCTGDSGGPLQCLNQNQSWFLEGIVSYGSSHYTKPAVYTKVLAYLEWITKTIENNTNVLI